jgi:sulfatase maturation enzyme AslB (radical SAM superfamily)
MSNEHSASPLSPWPAPAGGRRAYHAMIKPIEAICNLDCTYCYCDEILETHIRQYIEGQNRSEVVFSWQGGEPTLLGN